MICFSPVVCALDLDAESESALVSAADLAAREGSVLHLVTVRSTPDAQAGVRDEVEAYVDVALGAGAFRDLSPRVIVARDAGAAEAITSYAEEVVAGALVVGTHGRRGLRRLRLGSVAEEAMRASGRPVLLVPNLSASRSPGPNHPVLVAVNLAEPDALTLRTARAFADLYRAPLEGVTVIERPVDASASGPSAAERGRAEEDLRAFARQTGCALGPTHVRMGDAAGEIVSLARDRAAGVVVMGTHGHRGLGRVLFGSVTETVLRQVRCPVLTVHPER